MGSRASVLMVVVFAGVVSVSCLGGSSHPAVLRPKSPFAGGYRRVLGVISVPPVYPTGRSHPWRAVAVRGEGGFGGACQPCAGHRQRATSVARTGRDLVGQRQPCRQLAQSRRLPPVRLALGYLSPLQDCGDRTLRQTWSQAVVAPRLVGSTPAPLRWAEGAWLNEVRCLLAGRRHTNVRHQSPPEFADFGHDGHSLVTQSDNHSS